MQLQVSARRTPPPENCTRVDYQSLSPAFRGVVVKKIKRVNRDKIKVIYDCSGESHITEIQNNTRLLEEWKQKKKLSAHVVVQFNGTMNELPLGFKKKVRNELDEQRRRLYQV
ncbi:unnamed protein product [Cylicocyclus nassatus]|uniref:Uncharacterized protein n=1 Tax=Cylicocyclus nassatus TaxID=53992 RepID=A0AA36GTJ9_CYLNA|nr:unnamed protein product [Cylicocyclus nassatus]